MYTFTAKASQSPDPWVPLPWPQQNSHGGKRKSSGCRYKPNYLSLPSETSSYRRKCYTFCGVAPRRNAVKVRIRITALYSFLSKKVEKAPGISFACWRDSDHTQVRCTAFWFHSREKPLYEIIRKGPTTRWERNVNKAVTELSNDKTRNCISKS